MLRLVHEIQIREIKEGNLRAYYSLFEKYQAKLYQYVLKYSGSPYYAEETVQLTFIKVWEKREALSEQHDVSSQLFRIAKSTLIDLLRREKVRSTRELSDIYISDSLEEERTIYKEELQIVLSAVSDLPTQCREVFTMSRLDNLSHKEIAAQLSISPKTIETHITKALKILRKSLSAFF